MCDWVHSIDGGDLSTRGALAEHIGCAIADLVQSPEDREIGGNYCLCQVDIPATLAKFGYRNIEPDSDIYGHYVIVKLEGDTP